MKKNILYISPNKAKTKAVLQSINSNKNWCLLTAFSELEAIQQFLTHDISMVVFGCDVEKNIEQELSIFYKKIDPKIILLDSYGVRTDLLHQKN